MKKITLSLILLMLLLVGCIEPREVIEEKKELASLIEKYPNIEFKSLKRLNEIEFEKEKEYWEENCKIQIDSAPYYKAIYDDELAKLSIIAETSRMDIICIIEDLKTPIIITTNNQIDDSENSNIIIDNNDECMEFWGCTQWSTCINQEQERTCFDVAECGTNKNKPIEVQSCEDECEEVWICLDWSACTNGIQTRDCQKLNDCGLDTNYETQRTC